MRSYNNNSSLTAVDSTICDTISVVTISWFFNKVERSQWAEQFFNNIEGD